MKTIQLTAGVERIDIVWTCEIIGTGMSTTVSNFGGPSMNLQISPSGGPDFINANLLALAGIKQQFSNGTVMKETLSATSHKRVFALRFDPGMNAGDEFLGIDDGYEQLNIRLELLTTNDVKIGSPSGTITSIHVTGSINVHMNTNENDSKGYRQYILDQFGIDAKDSNTRVRRTLQSKRDIDSLLLMNPVDPAIIKSIKILRDTNLEQYEDFVEVGKTISEQVYNIADYVLFDPIEMIETGENSVIEFELGTVSSSTQIQFLTHYLFYEKEEPKTEKK
ncbi:MAG: hypothetical protein ACTSX4_13420 [Candidatus Helarchaeota archaeon]